MNTGFETLGLDLDERGVATLTLNRPDKHNALNDVLIRELREVAERIDRDEDIRVVVLTGAGKSFCAGGDINWFAANIELTRAERVAQSGELAAMLNELDQLPRPLIGCINGSAYGGGVGMVSICDIAVAADHARFGLTEVRLGLIPANISPYVVARIGVRNSRATMLSGELFGAGQAVAMGLLNEMVAAQNIDARIDQIVAEHLEAAPGAAAETKRLIRYVSSHAMSENMIYTADRLADAWEAEEGQTGVRCFLGRSRPPWRSRD